MSKTIHLSFEIEGPATNEGLSRQAARMANFLVDSGLVTDMLGEDTFLDEFTTYVGEGWSKDWPTEPGYYWFYGWRISSDYNPRLHFAKVYQAVSGLIVAVGGCSISREDGADGYWMPVRVPEAPE